MTSRPRTVALAQVRKIPLSSTRTTTKKPISVARWNTVKSSCTSPGSSTHSRVTMKTIAAAAIAEATRAPSGR